MQVYGGHGYIAESGVEQYVRDARIAMIYEGTNGIQALDLVGRKLPMKGGQAAQRLLGEMSAFIAGNKADDKLYHRHSGYPGGVRTRTARTVEALGGKPAVIALDILFIEPSARGPADS